MYVVSRLVLALLLSPSLLAQAPQFDADRMLVDAERLSSDDMQGRLVGTAGNARARALLIDRFREVGLEPVGAAFGHEFPIAPGLTGVNIVGRLAGRAPGAPWLVVSAHYDHIGVRNGRVFNGANDNASGAAALPALAGYFRAHPIEHPLLVVAFDAEERDLSGARAFVEASRTTGDPIAFNVNLDMIARDPNDTLWVSGVSRQPWLRPVVEAVARQAPIRLRMGYDDPARPSDDWTRLSDQWAFIEAGIPAVYVGVEDFALHHHPDDDFGSLRRDFYVGAVETVIRLIEGIDRSLVPAGPAR